MPTGIPWTDETINVVAGCTKVSPACDNCYAEQLASRIHKMASARGDSSLAEKYGSTVLDGEWNGHVSLDLSAMGKAAKWRKPRRIFIASMGDLFHSAVPFDFILRVFDRMQQLPRHTFQVLTKRPERALEFCGNYGIGSGNDWPKNVWAGCTAENQARADERIPILLKIPAPVHFVSVEPMLGPVDITPYIGHMTHQCKCGFHETEINIIPGNYGKWMCPECNRVTVDRRGLDLVIAGGETGPNARPAHPDWFRGLRDQCSAASVPFFFKSFGEWVDEFHPAFNTRSKLSDAFVTIEYGADGQPIDYLGTYMARVGKPAAGRLLDGVEYSQMPGEPR